MIGVDIHLAREHYITAITTRETDGAYSEMLCLSLHVSSRDKGSEFGRVGISTVNLFFSDLPHFQSFVDRLSQSAFDLDLAFNEHLQLVHNSLL